MIFGLANVMSDMIIESLLRGKGEHKKREPTMEERAEILFQYSAFIFPMMHRCFISITDEHEAAHPLLTSTSKRLFVYACDRSAALVWLMKNDMIWDASLVLRCISEATCKIMFLCYATESEREQRLNEFWNDLGEIEKLKSSNRIKEVLGSVQADETGGRFWLSTQMLSDEDEATLNARWPRQRKKQMEHKWSLFEMLKKTDEFLKQNGLSLFSMPEHVLNYGRASSLIHADQLALEVTLDHRNRPLDEKVNLTALHVSTNLSNSLRSALFTLTALFYAYGIEETDDLHEIVVHCEAFWKEAAVVEKKFHATQEALAEAIRRGEVER